MQVTWNKAFIYVFIHIDEHIYRCIHIYIYIFRGSIDKIPPGIRIKSGILGFYRGISLTKVAPP